MFEEIDKRFDEIVKIALANQLQVDFIKKAYQRAKELHASQLRKDGRPYISHPVEVALLLAKLDFDENVIAGALLHDTIEDCGYTPKQMRGEFNDIVFRLVDCVSAIDKTKYVFNKDNIFESMDFIKSSAEEQTFKKLITLGKENPCGFAIKFADRLHNLRTVESFSYPKQLEKVRETEKWVLPIAKALKSEYFYRAIKNECFKVINRQTAELFLKHFEIYHNSNKKNIQELELKFKEIFSNSSIRKVVIKNVREYKVFEDLTRLYKKVDLAKISQGQILKVANYNIFMIYSGCSHEEGISEVINLIQSKTQMKIIDVKIGGFTGKMYLFVEDEFKNKYNIYVLTESENKIVKTGTLDGQNLDKIDEENINQLDEDFIRIKTRSGEVKYIQKNSTVLDLAFKIHREIGFAFKYAIVNDSKTKLPPYTKINDGDKVEIVIDKSIEGKPVNRAELRWLAYVNTELAKRVLIKYFEKKL